MAKIEYGKIIRKSWETSLKHKWLWIIGIVAGAGAGGGGGSSNISNRIGDFGKESDNLPKDIFNNGLPSGVPEKAREVLGATTDVFMDWLSSISPVMWLGLGLGLVAAIVVGVLMTLVLRNWAKGSLIYGLKMAEEGKEVNLKTVSLGKWILIKHLILLGVVNSLIMIGALAATGIVGLIGTGIFSLADSLLPVWYALAGIVGFIWVVIVILVTAMIGVFAERLIVLHNYTPFQAWKKGLALSRGNFLPTLVMGVINNSLGCAIGCGGMMAIMTVLGIPFGIIIATSFRDGFNGGAGFGVVLLAIIGIAFINAIALLTGFLNVFRFSNWNLFFEEIMKDPAGPKL